MHKTQNFENLNSFMFDHVLCIVFFYWCLYRFLIILKFPNGNDLQMPTEIETNNYILNIQIIYHYMGAILINSTCFLPGHCLWGVAKGRKLILRLAVISICHCCNNQINILCGITNTIRESSGPSVNIKKVREIVSIISSSLLLIRNILHHICLP